MRWDQTEYVLKGVYLGLLLAVALHGPSWTDVALVAVCTGGGLAVSLAWAGWNRIRSGVPARGHVAGFLLFLLLENPRAVFTGLLAGLAGGAYLVIKNQGDEQAAFIAGSILGGVALGLALEHLRGVRDRAVRNYVGLGLAAAL